MNVSALRLQGLVVRADGRTLLGPVSLEVEEGEHILIVGPSGAGKTTLLRAIAGLARIDAGSVAIHGQAVSEGPRELVPPRDRGLGFLFQGGALWPHLSVRRTIEFVLRARRVPRGTWPARVAELLELVDLLGFEQRKPGTMSGGEKQRLALARALSAEPRILLLDEPLGPLDAGRRQSLLERLAALQAKLGLTILHVTHDPGEARSVADRVMTLERGRIVAGDQAQGALP